MVIVRVLLILALAAVAVSGILYLFTRDRRYLRFIVKVFKYTIFLLAAVMLYFVFERLVVTA